MPIIVRAAGKRFAAKRPSPNGINNYNTGYFDDIKYDARNHEPRQTAGEVIREFSEHSSSHALPHVILAYTSVAKVLWFILFAVGVIVIIVLTSKTLDDADTDVESDLRVNSGPLQFPAVTVCNLNPLRMSQKSLGGRYFDRAIDLLEKRLKTANQEEGEPIVGSSSYGTTTRKLYSQLTSTMSESILKQMGHQRDDFIQSCSYLGIACDVERDFKVLYHDTYGNCYVYNNNATSTKVTALAGSHLGLQLWLNVEQWEYVPWLSDEVGAVITVHDPGTYPAPEDQGVLLRPGWLTDVAVTLKNVSREGYVNPCTESRQFEDDYGYKYTPHVCKATCLQEKIVDTCGCGNPKKPLPKFTRACQQTNREQLLCMHQVTETYKLGQISCDCPQACKEANYDARASEARWPAQSYFTSVRNYVYGRDNDMFTKIDTNGFSKNLLKVNAYFPSLTYFETTEDISLKRVRVWAEIGMHWTTFAGFSVITWIELILLILTLGMVCCASAPGVM